MQREYPGEPENKQLFTARMDQFYTIVAGAYDVAIKVFPVWKRLLKRAIPHIQGPRVLEVSFGTGYLLTQYAGRFETYGVDYNERMVSTAEKNLERKGVTANIRKGDVEALPYEDEFFDSVVNTMAFSAYPDGTKAMSELYRVLKKGGKLILIDVNYPSNGNWLGTSIVKFLTVLDDIIRDMGELFLEFNFDYTDEEIGGFGSAHLYVAKKL